MRLLITGGTGFIGSHFIDLIRQQRADEIFATKRWRSPTDNVDHLPADAVRWLDCDLTDYVAVRNAVADARPDRVFHFAAQSYVPASYGNPLATDHANADGTIHLLEACAHEAARGHRFNKIVVVTSSEVYGNPVRIPIDENHPLHPVSPYAASKVAADAYAYVYATAHKLPVVRGRNFTTSGPRRGSVFFDSAWCWQIALMEQGKQDRVLKVGNLDSIRTVMDVRDCVRAYWSLGDLGVPGEAYNIAGTECFNLNEIVSTLRTLTHVPFDVQVVPELLRPADATDQRPDTSKFRRLTDWKPTISYRQTLIDTLDYWRAAA